MSESLLSINENLKQMSIKNIGSVSIVIPVYNSAQGLTTLMQQLVATMQKCGLPYEIIMVNDGSRDNSWEVIRELALHFKKLQGINLMRNYGQHNALLCGIRAAKSEVIVTIDDDLQHPPEEIHKLLEKLAEGYDVVYGTPAHERHGLWRDMASQVTKVALQSAMGVDIARKVSAFRAFRTQVRNAFVQYEGSFVSIDVLLTWGTTRFTSVAVRHEPRRIGKSNYTFKKLVVHAMNMITGFSTWPLQVASLIGFVFTLFGLAILVYVIGRFVIQGGSVPGFPFVASIIAIFSGAQLFALGIIGEYLARLHFRSMQRPVSVVREVVGSEQLVEEEKLTPV